MTKEELFAKKKTDGVGGILYIEDVEEFLKDKVIIQRGENRHQYADVLHEWVEDTAKELQYDASRDGRGEMWEQSAFMRANHSIKLRIKPKEPVYEWQWIYGLRGLDTRSAHISPHLTEPELKQYLNDRNSAYDDKHYFYHLIEETKRERKKN